MTDKEPSQYSTTEKEDRVRLEVVVTVVMVVDVVVVVMVLVVEVVVVKSGVAHSFKMRPSISVRWSVRPFVRSQVLKNF